MKVAIYCRVSTDTQELDQQIKACIKFCEYKEFEYDVFAEIGSGKSFFVRPEFNRMIEELKKLKYDGIVTFRFDRLGRNMVQAINFFEDMENLGIKIFSINENIDTSTPTGRALRDFILRLAQLERENISEATKQRLKAMKDSGKPIGRPVGAKDRRPRKNLGYILRQEKKRERKKWLNYTTPK